MSSAYPILLWWSWECVLYLIIIIKPEVYIINHCLGLGHETMVCALCLTMFFFLKALVVCAVTAAIFVDFRLKKPNVFSQHIGKKNWLSEFCRTNPPVLKCISIFCVNYFLRYYLMMQHQPIVKRVNGTHEWAHRPYQLLSAPYHCCLFKHRQQDERQPLQSSWPVPICT